MRSIFCCWPMIMVVERWKKLRSMALSNLQIKLSNVLVLTVCARNILTWSKKLFCKLANSNLQLIWMMSWKVTYPITLWTFDTLILFHIKMYRLYSFQASNYFMFLFRQLLRIVVFKKFFKAYILVTEKLVHILLCIIHLPSIRISISMLHNQNSIYYTFITLLCMKEDVIL